MLVPTRERGNEIKKHDIRFEEAATGNFSISFGMDLWIPAKAGIHRFGTLHRLPELIEKLRLLIVCHTFQEENKDSVVIRIFSSRKAIKKESRVYGG